MLTLAGMAGILFLILQDTAARFPTKAVNVVMTRGTVLLLIVRQAEKPRPGRFSWAPLEGSRRVCRQSLARRCGRRRWPVGLKGLAAMEKV